MIEIDVLAITSKVFALINVITVLSQNSRSIAPEKSQEFPIESFGESRLS